MLDVAASSSSSPLRSSTTAMDALNAFKVTKSPKNTPKTRAEMDDNDEEEEELEEDEGFISASSSWNNSAAAVGLLKNGEKPVILQEEAGSELAQQSLAVAEDEHESDDDNELEEDPMFAASTTAASSSSTLHAHNHAPEGSQQQSPPDDEGDSLSSASQLIRSITGKDMAVSHLDLGRHSDPHRQLCATTYSGKKIYFKRQKGNALIGDNISSVSKDPEALAKMALGLLQTPIHILLENIEKGTKVSVQKKAELENAHPAPAVLNTSFDKKGKGKESTSFKTKKGPDTWTDRYKPRTFTELLGDERTHRLAMSWLKEWDSCVFKSSHPNKKKNSLKRGRDGPPGTGYNANDSKDSPDPFGRPHDKILLLTGPPGLGKTTLAHVLAHQAGYQVTEINASDDRTAKTVHDKIRNSLESRALTSLGALSGNKPTCVVIDEIDGAGGGDAGFIRTLVKLVMDGTRVGPVKAKGKKQKEAQPLLRPIICICNDLYAPALRPLRPLARIVRFHAPTNAHLTKRLKTICDLEGLKTDSKSLTTLVEVAEGDMRSCLNTLQIIRKQTDVLEERVIKSTALGMKDMSTSVTAVWNKLFKMPGKKSKKGLPTDGRYIANLVKDLSTCGEYDKLSQTCFENYLKVKSPADGLSAICKALDWLQFYDRLDGKMKTDREYDVMPYIPYAFVPWNPLFAAVSNKTPEWPRIDYEMYLKRTAHQEIADTLRNSLPLGIKELFTGPNIVSELAPLLMRILTPDLKPVNQQLIRSEDRLALKKLVKIMLDLNLTFVQDKNEDGQIVYKLEPPLDVFVHYEGKRASDVPPARFNLRQLISRELEAEAVRRAGGTENANTSIGKQAGDIINAYKKPEKTGQPKTAKEAAAAIDFFGRPVIAKVSETAVEGDVEAEQIIVAPPKKRAKVFYKYHEGFSNAVRTNVKVLDLFR